MSPRTDMTPAPHRRRDEGDVSDFDPGKVTQPPYFAARKIRRPASGAQPRSTPRPINVTTAPLRVVSSVDAISSRISRDDGGKRSKVCAFAREASDCVRSFGFLRRGNRSTRRYGAFRSCAIDLGSHDKFFRRSGVVRCRHVRGEDFRCRCARWEIRPVALLTVAHMRIAFARLIPRRRRHENQSSTRDIPRNGSRADSFFFDKTSLSVTS